MAKSATARRKHQEETDRIREGFVPDVSKDFERAISKQISAASRAVETGDSVDAAIDRGAKGVKDAYRKVWENVFVDLAGRTFNAIEPQVKGFGGEDVDKWVKDVAKFLKSVGGGNITEINKETKKWVKRTVSRIVAEGAEAGIGVPEVARKLRKEWKELSKFRAERIARTEIVGASNAGSIAGAQDIAASADVAIRKVWVTFIDGQTRDAHVAANNQERAMDASFNVDGEALEFPGDPNGRAANIVNCRCSTVFTVV